MIIFRLYDIFWPYDTFWPYDIFWPMLFFSSAVPSGSGAFQMPTCPSASSSSAAASTLRGGRDNLRNASVTFSLFLA